MKKTVAKFQIGKQGLTKSFIENIKNSFKTREDVRISILKSAKRDKESVKKIAVEIIKNLGENFTYKIIGFTISIKKWRKVRRQKIVL